MSSSIIKPYDPTFKDAFYSINSEWLNEIYSITPGDEKMLRAPEKIVGGGGEVFFAGYLGQTVGTCALIKIDEEEYELAKMGVLKTFRGMKFGEALLVAAIHFARSRQAKKITLETAGRLKPAIALYEKFGFKRVGEEYKHPLFGRMIFKMELKL